MYHLNNMKINHLIKQSRSWFKEHWRGFVVTIIIGCLATITLGLQINTLIDGQNKFETITLEHLQNFPNPTERMINAPYLVPAYIVGTIADNMLLGARATSVIFGLLATVVLFMLLKRWFTTQIASVGSLLFVTSSWVLAVSHQATPLILLIITPLLLLVSLTKYVNAKQHVYASFLLLVASLALAAYVPFMFWPIIVVLGAMSYLYRHKLQQLSKKQILIAAGLYALLLVPMLISVTQYPGQLKELIGIPMILPDVTTYAKNFLWQFSTLFFVAQPFPELYVGSLALLDIFSVAMVFLGIYHFVKYMPKRRKFSFAFLVIVLAFVVPLSTIYQIPMTAYIPIIYILIASGVYELLRQWFSYFPRNPIARNSAVVIVAILIGLATLYNLQRFYIAWPNAPETKTVYVVQSNK